MPVRTIIIADVRLYRDGLTALLVATGRIDVVASSPATPAAYSQIERLRPDVLLFDMASADALNHIATLAAVHSWLKIVALGIPEHTSEIIACAEVGAVGYVAREASCEDLVKVLEAAVDGELRCSPRVAARLLQRVRELSRCDPAQLPSGSLTQREREVLRLIRAGSSNKEIAHDLGIELATAKNHVHHILEKLGIRRRSQAMATVRDPR